MESKLTLYTGSAFLQADVMSVYVALLEKGLTFNLYPFIPDRFDLVEKDQQISYLQCEFPDKMPLLVHGSAILFESTAIDEYLEESFSPPFYQALYPLDIYARAKARQLQAWLRRDFLLIRKERPIDKVCVTPLAIPLSVDAAVEAERLFCVAQALLPINNKSLFGAWSIADAELALMLNRFILNGDHVPLRLKSYAMVQWERPSIQAWLQLNFSQRRSERNE